MADLNIWLIIFIMWGLPLTHYRSKFRKMVYQTDDWRINIKPVFGKELMALFGKLYKDDLRFQKLRRFYIFYLAIYFILFGIYKFYS